jgi:hypothetical protein
MNEIDKHQKQELTWDNKPVRNTVEEVVTILAPMFAMFSTSKVDDNTVDAYVMMLRNVDPDVLRPAVLQAMNTCKFLPTVAEIREYIAANVLPGPNASTPKAQMEKPIPQKMFRLPDEEDKKQRMARLKRTRGWN